MYPRHFADSVLVMNTSAKPLPSKIELDEATIRRARRIESRAHLISYDTVTHQEPLSSAEEEFHIGYQQAKVCEYPPRWGGIDFPFSAKGEQGSVWELPLHVANHLVGQFKLGGAPLVILGPNDACPVEPLWRVLPDDNELAFKGFKSESDLEPIDRARMLNVSVVAGQLSRDGLAKSAPSGVTVGAAGA